MDYFEFTYKGNKLLAITVGVNKSTYCTYIEELSSAVLTSTVLSGFLIVPQSHAEKIKHKYKNKKYILWTVTKHKGLKKGCNSQLVSFLKSTIELNFLKFKFINNFALPRLIKFH